MKTTRYIIAAAIASAALFTGCNKENSLTGSVANEEIGAGNANVTYQLQTLLPPAGALIKWNTGYITVSEILFNGVHNNGEMLREEQYEGKVGKTLNLFNNSVLGTVNVPFNMFSSASLTMQLNPLNGTNSLFLSGGYSLAPKGDIPPMVIPVEVAINDPVMLSSVWLQNVRINDPDYLATLVMDMGQVTNGIDAGMLNSAEKVNGTILITSESNPNLYGIIISNLQQNLMKVQLMPQASIITASTVDPPVE